MDLIWLTEESYLLVALVLRAFWMSTGELVGAAVNVDTGAGSRESKWRPVRRRVASSRPNTRQILDVDQFGNLGGNDVHRVLRRVQPVSGAEQGADLPDLFVGRGLLEHPRNRQHRNSRFGGEASLALKNLAKRDPTLQHGIQVSTVHEDQGCSVGVGLDGASSEAVNRYEESEHMLCLCFNLPLEHMQVCRLESVRPPLHLEQVVIGVEGECAIYLFVFEVVRRREVPGQTARRYR